MEDVRSSGESSASRPIAMVMRQFAGSRVERQVLAQVFEVLWQVAGCPAPSLAGLADEPRRWPRGTSQIATASRVTEGVAS